MKQLNYDEFIGKKFGKLTIISWMRKPFGKNGWLKPFMECRCDCGNTTYVYKGNLFNGHATSCGCQKSISATKLMTKHGMRNASEYNIYRGMKARCKDKNNKNFSNYGGRGISVCKRWLGDSGFINFYNDMGSRPTQQHSIERKNVNGNYEPSNCVWATPKEQMKNLQISSMLTLRNLSRESGYSETQIIRLNRNGVLSGLVAKKFLGHKIYKREAITFLKAWRNRANKSDKV